ncbi:MAG TPA: hypothetical protein VK464_03235, partial [Symbiobacteriaceae bacterium]|nr:hypothetical protein [Symbiobacteriaceae bacterium]
MPRERFTYTVDFPGLRAPGLDVGRLIASFDVTDYTGTTEDRALAMRELVAAAVTMACRRLAVEQPELLQSQVVVDRAEGSLTLRLPTWFKGAPPESLVRVISEALANAASQSAGQAAASLVDAAVAALDPEEKLMLKKTYEAAAAALRAGNRRQGMQLLNRAEQQRAWHQAALQVGADVPAAAGAVRRTMPPMAALAADVEQVLSPAGDRDALFGDRSAVSGERAAVSGE